MLNGATTFYLSWAWHYACDSPL